MADALGLWVTAVERYEGSWRVGLWGPEEPTPWESYVSCAVSLAGGCAEILAYGDPGDGADLDLERAHEEAQRAEEDDGAPDDAMPRAGWLATSILSARWDAVLAIADALEERGELDAVDVGGVLSGYHEPGGGRLGRLDAPTVVPRGWGRRGDGSGRPPDGREDT